MTEANSLYEGRVNKEMAMAGLSERGLWKINLRFIADVIFGERFMLFVLSILHYQRHFNGKTNMDMLLE